MASLVRDHVNLARVETKDLATDERYIPDDVPFFQKVLRHMRPGADALSSDNRAADEKTALDQQPPQNEPISPEKNPSEPESIWKRFRNGSETVQKPSKNGLKTVHKFCENDR